MTASTSTKSKCLVCLQSMPPLQLRPRRGGGGRGGRPCLPWSAFRSLGPQHRIGLWCSGSLEAWHPVRSSGQRSAAVHSSPEPVHSPYWLQQPIWVEHPLHQPKQWPRGNRDGLNICYFPSLLYHFNHACKSVQVFCLNK